MWHKEDILVQNKLKSMDNREIDRSSIAGSLRLIDPTVLSFTSAAHPAASKLLNSD